ncbi:hypothetical protein IC582_013581 [Cucumis melo]
MESSRTLNLYKFVDAGSISCGSSKEERAQLLTARLLGTNYDQLLLIPYSFGNHWTLVVINLTKGAAFWIDPLKNRIDPDVTEVVERSFNIMNKKKPVWRVVKCPKQSEVVECGYYVMRFMRDIIMSTSTSIIQIVSITVIKLACIYFFVNKIHLEPLYCLQMKDSPHAYTQDDIDCIRSEWAEFVGKHVHCAENKIFCYTFCHIFCHILCTYFVTYFVIYFVIYFYVRATMENTVLEENTTVMFNINEVDKGLNKAKGNPIAFYKVLPQSIGAMKPYLRQLVDV